MKNSAETAFLTNKMIWQPRLSRNYNFRAKTTSPLPPRRNKLSKAAKELKDMELPQRSDKLLFFQLLRQFHVPAQKHGIIPKPQPERWNVVKTSCFETASVYVSKISRTIRSRFHQIRAVHRHYIRTNSLGL